MKKLTLVLTAVLVFGVTAVTKAQVDSKEATHAVAFKVPELAILDIEGGDVEFDLTGIITEAGATADFSKFKNNATYLNYTVLAKADEKGKNAKKQKISVSIDGEIPGVDILLEVGDATGKGVGSRGKSQRKSVKVLDTQLDEIVDEIGTCYTGDGIGNGHNLTYSLKLNKFEDLQAGNHSVDVTYTFTEK